MSDDISRLGAEMADLESRLRNGLQDALERAIEIGTSKAKHDHKWQNRTGDTEAAIFPNVSTTSDGGHGVIVVDSENAIRLNDGTPPHDIRPKEGQGFVGPLQTGQSRRKKGDIGTHRAALRWQQDGQTRFAAVVHHPGTQADPYLDRAAEATIEAFDAGVERVLDSIFGGD